MPTNKITIVEEIKSAIAYAFPFKASLLEKLKETFAIKRLLKHPIDTFRLLFAQRMNTQNFEHIIESACSVVGKIEPQTKQEAILCDQFLSFVQKPLQLLRFLGNADLTSNLSLILYFSAGQEKVIKDFLDPLLGMLAAIAGNDCESRAYNHYVEDFYRTLLAFLNYPENEENTTIGENAGQERAVIQREKDALLMQCLNMLLHLLDGKISNPVRPMPKTDADWRDYASKVFGNIKNTRYLANVVVAQQLLYIINEMVLQLPGSRQAENAQPFFKGVLLEQLKEAVLQAQIVHDTLGTTADKRLQAKEREAKRNDFIKKYHHLNAFLQEMFSTVEKDASFEERCHFIQDVLDVIFLDNTLRLIGSAFNVSANAERKFSQGAFSGDMPLTQKVSNEAENIYNRLIDRETLQQIAGEMIAKINGRPFFRKITDWCVNAVRVFFGFSSITEYRILTLAKTVIADNSSVTPGKFVKEIEGIRRENATSQSSLKILNHALKEMRAKLPFTLDTALERPPNRRSSNNEGWVRQQEIEVAQRLPFSKERVLAIAFPGVERVPGTSFIFALVKVCFQALKNIPVLNATAMQLAVSSIRETEAHMDRLLLSEQQQDPRLALKFKEALNALENIMVKFSGKGLVGSLWQVAQFPAFGRSWKQIKENSWNKFLEKSIVPEINAIVAPLFDLFGLLGENDESNPYFEKYKIEFLKQIEGMIFGSKAENKLCAPLLLAILSGPLQESVVEMKHREEMKNQEEEGNREEKIEAKEVAEHLHTVLNILRVVQSSPEKREIVNSLIAFLKKGKRMMHHTDGSSLLNKAFDEICQKMLSVGELALSKDEVKARNRQCQYLEERNQQIATKIRRPSIASQCGQKVTLGANMGERLFFIFSVIEEEFFSSILELCDHAFKSIVGSAEGQQQVHVARSSEENVRMLVQGADVSPYQDEDGDVFYDAQENVPRVIAAQSSILRRFSLSQSVQAAMPYRDEEGDVFYDAQENVSADAIVKQNSGLR